MILYREYPPQPALSAFVECLWTCSISPGNTPYSHRVLPDNGVDILWQEQRRQGFVVGMMTAANTVVADSKVHTVAVRFKPGCAGYFFTVPLDALTDTHADLCDIWRQGLGDRLSDALWTRQVDDLQRVAILERHLMERLALGGKFQFPAFVSHAIRAIESAGGLVRIESLAEAMGISRQHLAAGFRTRVGVSAKMFARICRFRAAMGSVRSARPGADGIDWAQLALDHGYFDQPHLIHEFREFSGSSPVSFAAEPQR